MLVILGMVLVSRREFIPSPVAQGATTWPAAAPIPISLERPTLVMFVHPECPCSIQSMEALSRILQGFGEQVDAHLVFYTWDPSEPDPRDGKLWRSAEVLSSVTLHADRGGRITDLFHVTSSGHALLYGGGKLLYSGVLSTSSDDTGMPAIIRHLEGAHSRTSPIADTPVN